MFGFTVNTYFASAFLLKKATICIVVMKLRLSDLKHVVDQEEICFKQSV
jgi:hypothetical protein